MAEPSIHTDILPHFQSGRDHYLNHDYAGALKANQGALELARSLGCPWGEARALRRVGVCLYRLGRSQESEDYLRQAQAQAVKLGWTDEQLFIANHLGATLRKTGDLQGAHDTLTGALSRATGREQIEARARLLGSTGALMDDLGDQAAAAEHYARYQELVQLIDDPARQANAAGLMSRALRLRGDHRRALQQADEEIRLGKQAGHPTRVGRGLMHRSEALVRLERIDEAEAAMAEAQDGIAAAGDSRHASRVYRASAQLAVDTGRLREADRFAKQAREAMGAASGEWETRASVELVCAKVAQQAGLHGEALWHLGEALECHLNRMEPIAAPELRRLTRFRRAELLDLASRVETAAGEVGRDGVEMDRIDGLKARLRALDDGYQPQAQEPRIESVGSWSTRIRQEAEERWRLLLPSQYGALSTLSSSDLVLADVLAHGPVGDLPRSLFLLLVTLERELLERLVLPLGERVKQPPQHLRALLGWKKTPPPGLGAIARDLSQSDPALRRLAEAHLNLDAATWEGLVGCSRLLNDAPPAVNGGPTASPVQARNDIAHGRAPVQGRLQADAVRRALTLGAAPALWIVTSLPTPK